MKLHNQEGVRKDREDPVIHVAPQSFNSAKGRLSNFYLSASAPYDPAHENRVKQLEREAQTFKKKSVKKKSADDNDESMWDRFMVMVGAAIVTSVVFVVAGVIGAAIWQALGPSLLMDFSTIARVMAVGGVLGSLPAGLSYLFTGKEKQELRAVQYAMNVAVMMAALGPLMAVAALGLMSSDMVAFAYLACAIGGAVLAVAGLAAWGIKRVFPGASTTVIEKIKRVSGHDDDEDLGPDLELRSQVRPAHYNNNNNNNNGDTALAGTAGFHHLYQMPGSSTAGQGQGPTGAPSSDAGATALRLSFDGNLT